MVRFFRCDNMRTITKDIQLTIDKFLFLPVAAEM